MTGSFSMVNIHICSLMFNKRDKLKGAAAVEIRKYSDNLS